LGNDNLNLLNDFKAVIEANNEGSAAAMEGILDLSYNCILEAIATRTVKKGALYLCPFAQRPVLLLGSRSLFFTDKGRIGAAEASIKKAAKKASAGERSRLPKDDSAFRNSSNPLLPEMKAIPQINPLKMLVVIGVMVIPITPLNGKVTLNILHQLATPELHREEPWSYSPTLFQSLLCPSCPWLLTFYLKLLWDPPPIWLLLIFASPLLPFYLWALLDLILFVWDNMLLLLD